MGQALSPWPQGCIGRGGGTPCVTFRLVVAPLRGPGRSPVLPFACCVGSLLSVGRCGRCSCWCVWWEAPPPPPQPTPSDISLTASASFNGILPPTALAGQGWQPVWACHGPPKLPKSLECGPFWNQNSVKNGLKMCFAKKDHRPLGMLKQINCTHFEPVVTHFRPSDASPPPPPHTQSDTEALCQPPPPPAHTCTA